MGVGMRRLKKVISFVTSMAVMLGLCSMVNAQSDIKVIQLSDSAAWSGDPNNVDIVGSEMTIVGEANVVYTGLNVGNELVEFKVKTNTRDWFGMKFRSDRPLNAPWDNTTGYFFMLQPGKAELMRQGSLESLMNKEYPEGLNPVDNEYHVVTAGAINVQNGVELILKVDGVELIRYTDTSEKRTTGSSVFSIYQYGSKTVSEVSVFADENSTIGGIVNRNAPAVKNTLSTKDNWFINRVVGMDSSGGNYTTMNNTNQTVVVSGRGGATSNTCLDSNVFAFDIKLEVIPDDSGSSGANPSATVLFRKQNRNTPSGTNSYGIRFTPSGLISLVRYNNGQAKIFPAYKTGLSFLETRKVIVEIIGDISGDEWVADVYIYIDGTTQAYKYRDYAYNPNLEPPAYFGVLNSDVNVKTTLSNIKYSGDIVDMQYDEEVYPVYFADVMQVGNRSFLHWEWRADGISYTKAVIANYEGKVIGEVAYPNKEFDITGFNKNSRLYIYAVNSDGKMSDAAVVDLTQKASDFYEENVERIVIRETDGNAGFFTKDSNKEYIPNGVNYVGIRFGDHATFEYDYGLIPSKYDPYTVEALMRQLKKNGYNFIRVFVIPGGRQAQNLGLGGIPNETEGLYIPYMECFTDFLKRAHRYGIYVMPCFGENEMISNKYFREMAGNTSGQAILFSKDGIKAKQQYIKWFLEYIKRRCPEAINSLIALSMQNEFAFNSTQAPFNQTSGTYTFIDGTKYDMSDDTQRRALANKAIQYYYKKMKEAIHEVDPEILLAEGTFSMMAVGKDMDSAKGLRTISGVNDTRFPMSAEELLATDIDFLDFHVYRYGAKGNAREVFEQNFKNMLFNTSKTKEYMKHKPVILGEYGAISSEIQESELDAGMEFATGLRNAAMENGFAGCSFWTIDTFEQTDVWCLMWDQGSYLGKLSLLTRDKKYNSNWNFSAYLNPTKLN